MYSPRHARPSCVPVRAAVTTTLTAVLLPIALAAPALADEPAPVTTSSTPSDTSTSTVAHEDSRASSAMRISADPIGNDGKSRVGVRLLADGSAVPQAEVVVESLSNGAWTAVGRLVTNAEGLATGRLPFPGETKVRASYAGSASHSPAVSPETTVRERTASTMRISAGQTGADNRAPIGVRLLAADGAPIRSAYVAVEALSGDGSWKYVGRLLTNNEGLAKGRLPFSRDTRVRSTFSGNTHNLPKTSPEAVVRFNTLGEQAVQIASQQQGKPYRYGSTGPNSFDCSGFTTYIYKTRLGKNIPRTSAQQAAALPKVPQSAKRPGDLLFFRSGGRVSHVGVYAGGGKMWAAPTTGDRVKLQAIYSSGYTVGRVG